MGKRKYPEVKGYWVYAIQVPSINKYYIGISKLQCSQRWNKANYKGIVIEPYLDEWDSMIKTVLVDGLSKEQAYQYEDNIIQALKINNLCINDKRSGLFRTNNANVYNKQYQNDVEYREYQKQYQKQWRLDNPEYQKQYKKQRYQNDAEYREKNKQRAKQYRLKKKLEKQNQMNLF